MAISSEQLKPIAGSHAGAIVAAIFVCTGILTFAGFYISSQFEKPRAFVTATYDPAVQELVYRSRNGDSMREVAFKAETELVVAERELRKHGIKETDGETSWTAAPVGNGDYECRQICVH